MKLFFHKVFHWEYWPFQLVYIPVYFVWAYFALKAKTIFFFNAANPKMKNGGFFNDSKKNIYDLIPKNYYPKTVLIAHEKTEAYLLSELQKNELEFPLIAKPDIGLRGAAVKKLHNTNELTEYHNKATFNYLLQDVIPYANEVGIFYVRFPDQESGNITGIVAKEYVIVTGDGKQTIEALIKQNPRYEMQLDILKKEWKNKLFEVLPKGEKLNLMPYGNHCRGSKFIDESYRITPKLNQVFDKVCTQIEGFYYGRLDVMFENWDELENGNHFLIVELNGSSSEPTHIYDAKHSLFFGWKELIRHLNYMFRISQMNQKKGTSYLTFSEGMKEFQLHMKHFKTITHF